MASTQGRGSTVPALRLGHRISVGQELVNDHFLPSHHSYVLVSLGYFWLGYVGGGIKLFNEHVDFAALRCTLSRFVSHRCKILFCSISRAKIPGFTYYKGWRKEISMLYVDVR